MTEDEGRFCWRWFDWAGWLALAVLGAALWFKTGDWVAGVVMIFAYPVIRAIAVGQSR